MKKEEGNWRILKKFLSERLKKPLKYPSFVIYFITIVLIVGSIGFSTEIITQWHLDDLNLSQLTTNASNIFIALIAASSVELILIKQDKLEHPFIQNDVQIIGISSLILGFFVWMLAIYFKDCILGLFFSVIGLIFSYLFWWVSNAGNETLMPLDDILSPIGGEPEDIQLEGNTSEFRTH